MFPSDRDRVGIIPYLFIPIWLCYHCYTKAYSLVKVRKQEYEMNAEISILMCGRKRPYANLVRAIKHIYRSSVGTKLRLRLRPSDVLIVKTSATRCSALAWTGSSIENN